MENEIATVQKILDIVFRKFKCLKQEELLFLRQFVSKDISEPLKSLLMFLELILIIPNSNTLALDIKDNALKVMLQAKALLNFLMEPVKSNNSVTTLEFVHIILKQIVEINFGILSPYEGINYLNNVLGMTSL